MDQQDTGQSCLYSGFSCLVYGHHEHILLPLDEFCCIIGVSDMYVKSVSANLLALRMNIYQVLYRKIRSIILQSIF